LDELKKGDVTQPNDESPQTSRNLTHTQTDAVYISCTVSVTDNSLNAPLLNRRNPEIPAFLEAIVFATRIFHGKKKCVLSKAFDIKHSSAKWCCKGFGLTTVSLIPKWNRPELCT
jgi:hypothetical protein